MTTTNFREWLAKTPEDLFGIDKEKTLPEEILRMRRAENYDKPGGELSPARLMSELVKMGPIKNKKPQILWTDTVGYGDYERPGALMAVMTPLGSLRINVRKLALDLEGTKVWALKKVIPLYDKFDVKDRGNVVETGMAYEYHEAIKKIDEAEHDAPKGDFKNTETLALKIAAATRRNHPSVMHYSGIRKHDENHYQIYFQYRGHGVGGPSPYSFQEQFDIHLKYYPDRGILRSWGTEVQSQRKGQSWSIAPSEWDEYFMPTQSMDEIKEAIIAAFMSY
jgi:hypothetical protein